ncbi:MAG: polyprenyl synthetase family protein [Chloroflexota bacterium]|nr:polyprenyl synthetase family protein [Chloroflexota bacterium]
MTSHAGVMTAPQAQASAREMTDLINDTLADVDARMNEAVDSDVTVLRDASRHIIGAGGKRVRPRLLMLAHLACGGDSLDDAVTIAAALELVHTASVVHDDINDHGVIRRGLPSVNALWGRTFALLTGDFLFTKVYELMAPYRDMNITLAEATVALVEGETLQAAAVKDGTYNREVYYRIIGLKTAALFKAAASLGGQLANADVRTIAALGNFGYNVGLAFQIVDDILDLTADSAQLGKTSGIDLDQGRGFAAAHIETESMADDPIAAIKRKALNSDTIAEGSLRAAQLVTMAISELDILPESEAKTLLIETAHSVVNRSF